MVPLTSYLCCGYVYLLLLLATSCDGQSKLHPDPTNREKEQILNLHKSVREAAGTGFNIVWDTALENLAKKNVLEIAKTCVMQHTKLTSNAQNTYSHPSDSLSSIYAGVDFWKMELDHYNRQVLHRNTDVYEELKTYGQSQKLGYISAVKRTADGDAISHNLYGHVLIMADDKYVRVGCAFAYNPNCNIRKTRFFNLVFCEYGTAGLGTQNNRVQGGKTRQVQPNGVQPAPSPASQTQPVVRPTSQFIPAPASRPPKTVRPTLQSSEAKTVPVAHSEKILTTYTGVSNPYKAEQASTVPCVNN